MQTLLRTLIPIGFLVAGWFGFSTLSVEKEKQLRPEPEPRVISTEVIELTLQDFKTVVRTQGVVRPTNEATLTSQVSGKVSSITPSLHDGAFFSKDDILLTLDDEDFTGAVIGAQAELARAEAALSQEEARAKQARLNWEDLGYKEEPNELVLRLPQLREATANLNAAKASLERAERDLARTVVQAPFDGRVLQRTVSVGQSISPATGLAIVFDTAFVEVRLPVAAKELAFLNLPESAVQPPVPVTLHDALNPESDSVWDARIVGTEGSIDENSRELFAIARVDDPFSRNSPPEAARPPLRIGQPVRGIIDGQTLPGVLVVPRTAVHRLNRIYLVTPELTLERREIEPLWSDEERLVIRDPTIPHGSLLATSRLVYFPNAAKVEILPTPEPDPDPDPEAARSANPSAGEVQPPGKTAALPQSSPTRA